VKHYSDNRWRSKAAAVNAISCQPEKVSAALEQLHDTVTKTLDTCGDAAVILNGTEKFELAALIYWSEVLSSIDWIH
jgi:hypothetical protein